MSKLIKRGDEARKALEAGVNSLADTASYIAAGTNVPLLVCNEERIEAYPDLPCTVENGFNVTYGKPRGFFAPKGTDQAILTYISSKMKEVCDKPEFVEAMANLGLPSERMTGLSA